MIVGAWRGVVDEQVSLFPPHMREHVLVDVGGMGHHT